MIVISAACLSSPQPTLDRWSDIQTSRIVPSGTRDGRPEQSFLELALLVAPSDPEHVRVIPTLDVRDGYVRSRSREPIASDAARSRSRHPEEAQQAARRCGPRVCTRAIIGIAYPQRAVLQVHASRIARSHSFGVPISAATSRPRTCLYCLWLGRAACICRLGPGNEPYAEALQVGPDRLCILLAS